MKYVRPLLAAVVLIVVTLLMAAPVAASSLLGKLAPIAQAQGTLIPDQYIVVFKSGTSTKASMIARSNGVAATFIYDAVFNGFAARLNPSQLGAMRRNPNVAYVEQDQVITSDTTQSSATWGLDRIDQRNLPLSGTYTYTKNGTGVYAYIIDTGIQTSHSDFGGRAAVAYDATGGNGQDCNGHGTHVAGTVGGAKYGVAKGVQLRAVRVLNCSGSGSNSGVIAGVDWVRQHHTNPAVANMSLGGGYSSALNSAVTSMINSGVFLAVAAGNSNANACNYSPSSASGTLTVAAADKTDTKASFSNYGACVDVYAPGVSITSDWLNGGTNTISGTSMASPHAAGVAALYKANFGNVASSTIVSWLINNATSSAIKSNPSGTPNKLLYKSSL
ncbi:MAG: S8 family peptidase [Chloroflexota bacterium]|nr:S8 family peptidase [Chloroflexota bacterium]